MNHRYIAIMAGGIGSRFWPASTIDRPKQFLDILGTGRSLLQMTCDRATQLVDYTRIYVMTNKRYKDLVMEHLPDLPENNILCEPSMNNTAPAIAYMALRLKAVDPDAIFAVLPSDHVILKEDTYLRLLNIAFEAASSRNVLMTLGIKPTRPDTGYGYIQYTHKQGFNDMYKVKAFREKPDLSTAKAYVASDDYLWNAGMFVWSVEAILSAFNSYAPEILKILTEDLSRFSSAREQDYVDRVYPNTPNISIDYAILEKADNVFTIPADIGWSDLGTWNSLHTFLSSADDKVTIGKNIFLEDCKDIIVLSNNHKQIVIKGLSDYIVIDEDNALLIYPKSAEQEIKSVVNKLKN